MEVIIDLEVLLANAEVTLNPLTLWSRTINFSPFFTCLPDLVSIALQWINPMSFDFAKKNTLSINSGSKYKCTFCNTL